MPWGVLLNLSKVVEATSPTPPQTTDMSTNQGLALFQEGEKLLKEGDFEQALDAYEQALASFQSSLDRQMEGETLVQLGWIYANSGQYQKALAYLEQALTIFQTISNREDQSGTLTFIGIVHSMYNRYEEALRVFEQALNISGETNNTEVEGVTLNQIGETYRRLGHFTQALEYYQQALTYAYELEDHFSEGRNRANIGSVYVELGQYTEAFQAYQEALLILGQVGDYEGETSIYNNLGTTYMRLGENRKALENFQKAREISKSINDRRNEATALTGIGLVYDDRCQENFGYCLKALTTYQQALEIQEKIDDRGGQANTLHNIGGGYDRLGWEAHVPVYHHQALQFYQKSLEKTEAIGEPAEQARTFNNIGEVYIHLSVYENKEEYLEKAMATLREALTIYETIGDRARAWITVSNMGWALELQGKFREALRTNKQAIESLEKIIISLGGIEEFKVSLGAQAAATYQRTILLLMQMGQPEQAFEFSERARARVLLDQLGNMRLRARDKADESLIQQERTLRLELAELDRRLREQLAKPEKQQDNELIQLLKKQREQKHHDYEELLLKLKLSNPEYVSLVRVEPLNLKDVQAFQNQLSQKISVLSYFVTPYKTLAFIITRDTFEAVELPVGENELRTTIAKAHKPGKSNESPSEAFEDLYTWLITPLKPHLTAPVIGIIPHSVLHYLPFAALTDRQRYFGEEYTLFSLPSVSVLQFLQKKKKPADGDEFPSWEGVGVGTVLAMAHSQPEGYLPLYYAEQEVHTITRLHKAHTLTGKQATESAFKDLASDFSIVHLAAHGELDTNSPLFSRILLAPDEQNDGALNVHEVYELNLPQTDLVVLSACETKLGKRSRGDDIIGLTRAFIYAGTPSVVASLWKVDDQTTSDFMTAFYKQLKRGKSKAEALQIAQMKTRRKYPHPYYWAAFVLTGDPGTTTERMPWLFIILIVLIVGVILIMVLLKLKSHFFG